jgi:1,4-alpha-glucan branching enzyme
MKIRHCLTVIFLSFLLFVSSRSLGQVVVPIPTYPVDNDSVTIIFDAAQGNAALKDVTPPIYAHTGVITNLSTSSTDWKHVIAQWSENTTKAMLTPLGNNLYQLKIGPTIREWYNVPASEEIQKMAFVFRNSDGSKVGREANGGDIFVDVYPSVLSVNITKPTNKSLYINLGDSIPVSAISPLADSLQIISNGVVLKSMTGQVISDTIFGDNFGQNWTPHWVKVVAWNGTASVADSFAYTVLPLPTVAVLPNGIVDGINYLDSTTVILCLFAPEKKNVFVIGDFNNWQMDSSTYMNITPDSKRYWIQLTNLVPGQEYIFQYLVDGNIRIGDPYADKVSDPDDKFINAATYPNLKPYPSDKTTGVATYLQTNQVPYTWNNSSFTPPKVTDLVIYELLIRDFTAAHTFAVLSDTIDYLKRLGVNAIELMPVMEFEGNSSWGYNPDYLFAVDKYYGPKNELKHFIEVAHSKGIAVILDIVCNHQFGQSPLVKLYWDGAAPAANSPWFNQVPRHPYNVGFDFNHESPYTKAYMERVVKYWITEYHVDGYRFDLSKGFTQKNSYPDNVALWGQYDASRIAILKNYNNVIRSVKPNAYVILEHFADNSEEKELASNGMLLWGNITGPYGEASKGFFANNASDLSKASYKQRGWSEPNLVSYMESHDEERIMFKNISAGNNSQSDYNVRDTTIGLKRAALAANLYFTIPGPKMIWEFEERGFDYSINYPCMNSTCRLSPKPPRWDYMDQWRRDYLYNVFASLIELKKTLPVFETTNFTMSVSTSLKKIVLKDPSMNVVALGNFNVTDKDMILEFPSTGMWYEYFTGDSISYTGGFDTLQLAAGEYRLYSSVRLPKPLFTGVDDEPGPQGVQTGSLKVYPNPFTDHFMIVAPSRLKMVEVYSILGKKVNVIQSQREENAEIHMNNVPAGTYLIRAIAEDGTPYFGKVIRKQD